MILKIVKYGNPILKEKCEPIEEITPEITQLINNMKETLLETNIGIGLAAPQVGVKKRLFIYSNLKENLDPKLRICALINPKVVKTIGSDTDVEGCLSVPGMHAQVTRPYRVIIEGQNENGIFVRIKGEGLLARCLLHENDHLDGILYTDKAEPNTLAPDEDLDKK